MWRKVNRFISRHSFYDKYCNLFIFITFQDITKRNTWGEAACMHSQTGIRCTFLYHDWGHMFHKKIIWQPEPGVIVLGTVPTRNWPSYHPYPFPDTTRSKNRQSITRQSIFDNMYMHDLMKNYKPKPKPKPRPV